MTKKYFLCLFLVLLPCMSFSKTPEVSGDLETVVTSICNELDKNESIKDITQTLFDDDYTDEQLQLIKEVARLYKKGHSINEIISVMQQSKSEKSYSEKAKALLSSPSFWIKVGITAGACVGLYCLYRHLTRAARENNAQQQLQNFIQNQQVDVNNLAQHIEQDLEQERQQLRQEQAQFHANVHNLEQPQAQQNQQLDFLRQQRAAVNQAHEQRLQEINQQEAVNIEAIRQRHLAERQRLEEIRRDANHFDQRILVIDQQLAHEREQHRVQLEAFNEQLRLAQSPQAAVHAINAFRNEQQHHQERYAELGQQQQALRDQRAAFINAQQAHAQ